MRTIAAASLLTLALAAPLKKRDDGQFLAPLSVQGETIDDSYIVVFRKDVKQDQIALHLGSVEESHGLDVSRLICSPSVETGWRKHCRGKAARWRIYQMVGSWWLNSYALLEGISEVSGGNMSVTREAGSSAVRKLKQACP